MRHWVRQGGVLKKMIGVTANEKSEAKRRLTKEARREQLIENAFDIVRELGADALTLSVLAERAGVSKPITYEHFETRSGLLVALYRRIDQQQVKVLQESLSRAGGQLTETVRLIANAYMTCHSASGSEGHAISAALMGDPQMGAVQQELMDNCVGIFADALAPFSRLSHEALQQRCIGIVGAAEALSLAMTRGRMSQAAAIENLSALLLIGIEPG
jgi:AcrR family transcriptional regulator